MQMAKLPSLSIILSKRSGFHPSTAEIVAFFIWHHFYIRTNGGFYLEFYTKDENYQLVQGVVGPRWSLSVTRFNNIAILERFDSADNTVFPIQYKNMYTMPQWYYHCSDTFGNISFVHPSCAQTLQWLS